MISVASERSTIFLYNSKIPGNVWLSNLRSCATLPCSSATRSGAPNGSVHSAVRSNAPPATTMASVAAGRATGRSEGVGRRSRTRASAPAHSAAIQVTP